MCGIIGALGPYPFTEKEKAIVKDMFYLDTVRGKDSSGCIIYNHMNSDGAFVEKALGLPNSLEVKSEFSKKFDNPFNVFVGHNRKATSGAISSDNAHPFKKGSVIGVHNGTLHRGDIERLGKLSLIKDPKSVTDTELLYDVLAIHGIKTVWKNISGAATLVWMDEKDESVNFASNGKRPFFYWISPTSRMFFASEPWMMLVAISRIFEGMEVKPIQLKHNIHYRVTREIKKGKKIGFHSHIVQTELPKSNFSWEKIYNDGVYVPHHNRFGTRYYPVSTEVKKLPPKGGANGDGPAKKQAVPPVKKIDQIPFAGMIQRDDGTFVKIEELSKLTCSFCHDPLYFGKCKLYSIDLQMCDECVAIQEHLQP